MIADMYFERLSTGWLSFQAQERASARVLVVDDEPSVRLLIFELMSAQGYSVDQGESIAEAEALLGSRSYQLLVIDKNLPDGSGIELLESLREAGNETPAVIITGYPSAETIMEALSSGASDYISKPFQDVSLVLKRLESIIDARMARRLNDRMVQDLSKALEAKGPDHDQVERVAKQLFEHKRALGERISVLVVEDNLAVAEVVRKALVEAKLTVEVATNIKAATAWAQRGDGPLAALLSVDLSRALSMIEELRRVDELLEIVVTTGSTDVELALGAITAGAADYVLRPFEGIAVLRSRMKRAVARARRRRLYLHLISTLYQEAKRAGPKAMERLNPLFPALEATSHGQTRPEPRAPASSIVFAEEVDLSDLFADMADLEVPLDHSEPPAPVVSIRNEEARSPEDLEGDERRKHKRIGASLEVRFQPVTEEGLNFGSLVFSHLRDISAGGMFIAMDQPFPIGTLLSVELDLGWGMEPVLLTCEVVRRVTKSASTRTRAGIGVRFDEEVQPEVERLISSLAERIVPV